MSRIDESQKHNAEQKKPDTPSMCCIVQLYEVLPVELEIRSVVGAGEIDGLRARKQGLPEEANVL